MYTVKFACGCVVDRDEFGAIGQKCCTVASQLYKSDGYNYDQIEQEHRQNEAHLGVREGYFDSDIEAWYNSIASERGL